MPPSIRLTWSTYGYEQKRSQKRQCLIEGTRKSKGVLENFVEKYYTKIKLCGVIQKGAMWVSEMTNAHEKEGTKNNFRTEKMFCVLKCNEIKVK